MEKIASFTVNHLCLLPGVYVSRKDNVGSNVITTFDLRFTRPNIEPALETAPIHAIEHLGATFLRNEPNWADRVIYFGPMGCRTGFYLILSGDLQSKDILELLENMLVYISNYESEIPGATARDCGNYLDLNLKTAKYHANNYLNNVLKNITEERMNYSEE
ncbi:S-ribosylhomocysteine lyase [Clostridium sp. DL1XJH146]